MSLSEALVNRGSVFQASVTWWPSWFRSRRVVIWCSWWRGTSPFTCTSPSGHATSRNTSAAPPWSSSPSPSSSSWSSRWPGSSSTTSSASDTPTPGTATRYRPEKHRLVKLEVLLTCVLQSLYICYSFAQNDHLCENQIRLSD